jgi:hypothetical protein
MLSRVKLSGLALLLQTERKLKFENFFFIVALHIYVAVQTRSSYLRLGRHCSLLVKICTRAGKQQ